MWRAAPATPTAHALAALTTGALIAAAVIDLVAHPHAASHGSDNQLWAALTLIGVLQVAAAALYSAYLIPATLCTMLLITSYSENSALSPVRLTVLFCGSLAGTTYTVMAQWWRQVLPCLRSIASRDEVAEHARTLFEVGQRYLAAWGLLLVTGIAQSIASASGLTESELFLQDAGGIVVFVDLVALVPGRWRRASALLRSRRPKPYPRLSG